MNEFLSELPPSAVLLIPLLVGGIAVWWMLPRLDRKRPFLGVLLGAIGFAAVVALWFRPSGQWVHDLPFYLFSGAAVGAAVLMITDHDPVHSALWFALTTLSVCGLFLLRSAAFLAAATTIVYAGAIIVIFLFVIMLARQAGEARYDRQAAQSLAATLITLVLLGGIVSSLHAWQDEEATARQLFRPPPVLVTNSLSEPVENAEFGTLRGLGRSLFGDYLLAVEVAGTLLVVAAVGAIAIAPRTPRGTL